MPRTAPVSASRRRVSRRVPRGSTSRAVSPRARSPNGWACRPTKAHRLIARATREGLVRVFVDAEVSECVALEEALTVRYGLHICRVAPDLGEGPLPLGALGLAGAAYLRALLEHRAHRRIGIGQGRTLSAVVKALPLDAVPGRRVRLAAWGTHQKIRRQSVRRDSRARREDRRGGLPAAGAAVCEVAVGQGGVDGAGGHPRRVRDEPRRLAAPRRGGRGGRARPPERDGDGGRGRDRRASRGRRGGRDPGPLLRFAWMRRGGAVCAGARCLPTSRSCAGA